jgi:hypothetical protein
MNTTLESKARERERERERDRDREKGAISNGDLLSIED